MRTIKNLTGPQEVFQQIINFGVPEHYQSDLYHDAIWLSNYWKDVEQKIREKSSFSFYYALRPMGTHIGQSKRKVIDIPCKTSEFIGAWKFVISPGRYNYEMWLDITKMLCPDCISTIYGSESHECVCKGE